MWDKVYLLIVVVVLWLRTVSTVVWAFWGSPGGEGYIVEADEFFTDSWSSKL